MQQKINGYFKNRMFRRLKVKKTAQVYALMVKMMMMMMIMSEIKVDRRRILGGKGAMPPPQDAKVALFA